MSASTMITATPSASTMQPVPLHLVCLHKSIGLFLTVSESAHLMVPWCACPCSGIGVASACGRRLLQRARLAARVAGRGQLLGPRGHGQLDGLRAGLRRLGDSLQRAAGRADGRAVRHHTAPVPPGRVLGDGRPRVQALQRGFVYCTLALHLLRHLCCALPTGEYSDKVHVLKCKPCPNGQARFRSFLLQLAASLCKLSSRPVPELDGPVRVPQVVRAADCTAIWCGLLTVLCSSSALRAASRTTMWTRRATARPATWPPSLRASGPPSAPPAPMVRVCSFGRLVDCGSSSHLDWSLSAGSHQEETGKSSCKPCDPGSYSSASTTKIQCTRCDVGEE